MLLSIEDDIAQLRAMELLISRMPGWRLASAATVEAGVALASEREPDVTLIAPRLWPRTKPDAANRLHALSENANNRVFSIADGVDGDGMDNTVPRPMTVNNMQALLDAEICPPKAS